ncbi:hypothetical protein SAY87_032084 [Trapa incisa]|uniref:NPK1-activating kinesin-like protein C-terminal domain-containing protein n=1 Tax=Trapa incisa TaxID=236973 RepID=A0AAN7KQS3_9MYRT|nr:hypothetical protein SAY87_032084 [Trapa incisa]
MVRKSEEDQNEDIKEENPKCPEKMGAESGDINYEATYDSMNKKIQDVQSTINCLVSLYPTADQSPPTSPNVDAVNTISMKIMRSRSSRTMLMGVPPYSISKASDLGFSGNLETPPLEFQDDFKKTWRKDFPISMQKVNEIAPNNQKPELEKYGPIVKVEPYDWEMEFRKKQRKIIKLWQACCVPLQHRTYFFLLFKGDSSDAVYMEVELRRLSFLRGTYISQSLKLASSLKALNKEREILGKRILKMFRRHEREILYRAWNIGLDTKQRSQQLARKLWTDTRDMAHVEASAGLISRLVDWSQTGLVRKEMFGLNFSPQPLLARRFNFGWQFSMSSLSFAASQV